MPSPGLLSKSRRFNSPTGSRQSHSLRAFEKLYKAVWSLIAHYGREYRRRRCSAPYCNIRPGRNLDHKVLSRAMAQVPTLKRFTANLTS